MNPPSASLPLPPPSLSLCPTSWVPLVKCHSYSGTCNTLSKNPHSRGRYTGPPYVKMNGSLRFASKRFPEALTAHLKGNKYTNLVYACNSLLRKFSQISHIPRKRCAISTVRYFN